MTHSTQSAIAARDAQSALDARREQQLQATTAAIARVACLVASKSLKLAESLGFTRQELLDLKFGVTKEHEKLAADIIADAFHPDMIHTIMLRFGGFEALRDCDEESFATIKNELKGIGKP